MSGPVPKGYGLFHLVPTQGYGVLNFQSDPEDLFNFIKEVKRTKYVTITAGVKKEHEDKINIVSDVSMKSGSAIDIRSSVRKLIQKDINVSGSIMKSKHSECNIKSRIDNSKLISILQVL